jgi:acylphosphatase
MNQCIAFRVQGKVQGVYYRAHTKATAQSLGLTGFARNEDDGSVLVVACGPQEALAVFEAWLWKGSPASDVQEVSRSPSELEPFEGFSTL